MKPSSLVTVLLLALSSVAAVPVIAQPNVSATVTQGGQTSFKIEEPGFIIYLSNAGKIADFSINSKGRISYDFQGRLEKVGAVAIDYDLHNRVEKIGSAKISYDLHNRVDQVGSLRVSYDLHGRIEQIGSTRISYDMRGRVENIEG